MGPVAAVPRMRYARISRSPLPAFRKAAPQGNGGDVLAVLPLGPEGVCLPDQVEDYAVVIRVPVVAVGRPVPGADVDFHVAPQQAAALHVNGCVQEVGAPGPVVPAGKDHLDPGPVHGAQPPRIELPPRPCPVEKALVGRSARVAKDVHLPVVPLRLGTPVGAVFGAGLFGDHAEKGDRSAPGSVEARLPLADGLLPDPEAPGQLTLRNPEPSPELLYGVGVPLPSLGPFLRHEMIIHVSV